MTRLVSMTMVAVLAGLTPTVYAQQVEFDNSANSILPSCRHAGSDRNVPAGALFSAGFCMGLIAGLNYMGRPEICSPPGVTNVQLTQVVIRYLDQHPERTHESFKTLALEAMTKAWPCKARQ